MIPPGFSTYPQITRDVVAHQLVPLGLLHNKDRQVTTFITNSSLSNPQISHLHDRELLQQSQVITLA